MVRHGLGGVLVLGFARDCPSAQPMDPHIHMYICVHIYICIHTYCLRCVRGGAVSATDTYSSSPEAKKWALMNQTPTVGGEVQSVPIGTACEACWTFWEAAYKSQYGEFQKFADAYNSKKDVADAIDKAEVVWKNQLEADFNLQTVFIERGHRLDIERQFLVVSESELRALFGVDRMKKSITKPLHSIQAPNEQDPSKLETLYCFEHPAAKYRTARLMVSMGGASAGKLCRSPHHATKLKVRMSSPTKFPDRGRPYALWLHRGWRTSRRCSLPMASRTLSPVIQVEGRHPSTARATATRRTATMSRTPRTWSAPRLPRPRAQTSATSALPRRTDRKFLHSKRQERRPLTAGAALPRD